MVTANFSYTYQWVLSSISNFTMWTQHVIDKISNRSMNNIWRLLTISQKDTRTKFLLLTLNKLHTSFGGLKWWYGSYLCKCFWLKLYCQYLRNVYIMYYSLRYYKEETQLVRLFFTKGAVDLVVKILEKYTYKSFSKNKIVNLRILASKNWCIHIS